jgi:hypothetical protein
MPIEPKNLDRRNFDDIPDEKFGNYVYALRDPRDNKVFYIGQATKTQKNRLFSHLDNAQNCIDNNSYSEADEKTLRIIEIWAAEDDVDWFILARRLEDNALNFVESSAIDLLSISQNGPALNRNRGPQTSLLTQDEINDLGAARVNPITQILTVFIFPIQNQLANNVNTYDATRRAWYVKAEFRDRQEAIAIGLSNYISRGVYSIDNWHPLGNRHEFDGRVNNRIDLSNKNWYKIISFSFGYWQRGTYLIVEFNGQGQFKFLRGNPDKETWFNLNE